MDESLAVIGLSETAFVEEGARFGRGLRWKVAVATAIPVVGILVQSAHAAWAVGCSCG